MASDSIAAIWELWTESAKTSETLGDPLLLECLEAGGSSKIFEDLPDDKLKSSLSLINSILNDPKTRLKGITLFGELLDQVNVSRLIGFQDSVISGLHLVVKGLESSAACSVFAKFLPKCHVMSDVNQAVTSSIIPKILSHICEDGKDAANQKTTEEILLLKVCLETYHGPCGPFRERLEKTLTPIVDSDNIDLIECLSEVFPLVSYAGGGGNAGEKHSKDWNEMLLKFLKSTHSTLCQLFGDTCFSLDVENVFDGGELNLKRVTEAKLLLRMTFLKRRLRNLISIVAGYLRCSFPAPKQVPVKGLLQLIQSITSLSPVPVKKPDKGLMKEAVFLTAVTSSIHVVSLKMLRSLIYCIGTNVLVEGVVVEQIISSEFKWLQERRAYEILRLELYETLLAWLVATGGIVTNQKTLSLWINAIGDDTRIEKDVIELRDLSKKPGKLVRKNAQAISSLDSTTSQSFVQKSQSLCQIALSTLTHLIPALDMDNHRIVLEHLIKTASILSHHQPPPPPYDNALCRRFLLENISKLCFNPHPRSPVSLSLVMSLLRRGMQDPTRLVSSFCSSQISILERIMHPASAPVGLAGSVPAPIVVVNSVAEKITNANGNDNDQEDEIEEVDLASTDDSNEGVGKATSTVDQSQASSKNSELVSEAIQNLIDAGSLKKIINDAVMEALRTADSPAVAKPHRNLEASTYSVSSSSGHKDTFFFENDLNRRLEQSMTSESQVPSNHASPKKATQLTFDNSIRNHTSMNGDSHEEIEVEEDSSDSVQALNEPSDSFNETSKRPASQMEDGDKEDSVLEMKKSKPSDSVPSTPAKETNDEDVGPSVEEMMSSFVDVEAEAGL